MTEADRLEFWRGFWNKETTMQKVESVEDIVEVVRCKDCKSHNKYGECIRHYNYCGFFELVDDDDFCSYGERKE